MSKTAGLDASSGGGEEQDAARTRKHFLVTAGGGALLALSGLAGLGLVARAPDANIRAGASPAQTGRTWVFRSRPDLRPPPVEVTTPAGGAYPGYVFAAAKNGPGEAHPSQDGPMILDNEGRPVWLWPVREEARDAMDFKAQSYRGKPVITWWEGVHGGFGRGEYVIFDDSYREVARVRAGNGYEGDHHEFLITARDTALLVIYGPARRDLSAVGGAPDGAVLEGVIQEIDVASGEVLFEWHSLEHVDVSESYRRPRPDQREAFDYFHINSVDVDKDENLIVSARRTSAVYKIDRRSGEVIWRLGGKRSDFEMGEGARFAFQHDARRHPDGTITLFDNRGEDMREPSRAVALTLDEGAMKATLAREYVHPDRFFAIFQGNVQALPGGNVFVGWGSAPYLSEFSREGKLLFDARFPSEAESYRAFRFPWKGLPKDRPAVAAGPRSEDRTTLYVSWNGATEVAAWEVLAGPAPDRLEPLGSAPRRGFETAITFTTPEPYVAVSAKDRSGLTLATSEAVRLGR
ncbi:ArsR family transcriptional regulator (plasmid) [Rubrobacter tropicus]|uniref:ArsR family transcriptional regulator n=1 Tax=Rubrobacter tropicus TaxID=2653851 RepID=A0A6G8QFS5_9ACTN|nr:arylsulfotransferase family protein [Rubrobacter tropicus]QIN85366.1 ArsR family transcriptional regulator [Rubrobacter tropicus]